MEKSVSSRPPMTPSVHSSSSIKNIKSRIGSASRTDSCSTNEVDENTFLENFEKVPMIQIYTVRDIEDNLKKYHDILKNKNEDWENRVDCLKKIRAIVIAGGLKYEEFYENLIRLQHAFQAAIDDLRSVVVREACITVAFLSKSSENKLERFCEAVLPNLISLVQKSPKVFVSSGTACIRFIIQYTHGPRLIPIITNSMNSKSNLVRRACCEFINLILKTWHTQTIKKNVVNVRDALRKGIMDGDKDARSYSRDAFAEFAHHFPDYAESLKNSLDMIYRKQLECGSVNGSSSSLHKYGGAGDSKLIRSTVNSAVSVRSNSAIDLQAAKRAHARAQYAAMARQKFGAANSANKTKPATSLSSTPVTAESRSGRTKNRVSISQPSSRSGSPSSRFSSYSHYLANTGTPISRSRKGSIGNDTSRETSPSRTFTSPFGFKRSTQPVRRPAATQRMLQQSREAESELAGALGNISDLSGHYFKPASSKSVFRNADDHSDESETSSLCSDHSFDSYSHSHRRISDSMSWNGSQHRLYRDMDDTLKSIEEIIVSCENPQWNIRKKGLSDLQYYLTGNRLELADLKRLIDIFLRIFNDPQVKSFSLFLDALNELIRQYSNDLLYCLHLLLTRLFNKFGANHLFDMVNSKIEKTLDNVFDSFPHEHQMQSVFRFLADPTQTPNNRVKLKVVSYLVKLTAADDSRLALNSNGSKDNASLALTKMISWTMPDNLKSNPELRRASKEAIVRLFNLNHPQMTERFASMPSEYQEVAQEICRNACSTRFDSFTDPRANDSNVNSSIEMNASNASFGAKSNHKSSSPFVEVNCDITDSQHKDASTTLKSYVTELSKVSDKIPEKREVLLKLNKFVQECPSDAIITHFRPLLTPIVSLMAPSEPASIKQIVLNLMQTIVQRKTVNFLVKEFSVLIITRVITLYADPAKEVVKAAESCAIVLSTNLPVEQVVKTVVPLISTSETAPIKLISIKMLTKLVENSDSTVFLENINQIMSVLLIAYDDVESAVRKAAVFCMVSLYRHSEEMKNALEPYMERLPNAKKKLLELYIDRAERGSHNSSITTSPRNGFSIGD